MSARGASAAVLAAALGALVLAVYALVARNDCINLDDGFFVYANDLVRQGLNPRTALWSLTTAENCNWYPLTRLTHLADVSLFGMWAGGHHLASAAWHAAAAALLFLALRLMTGGLWRPFAVAALFAVHPLNVEAVAWAAERSMVLAGFFFALTLLLWTRYVRRPGPWRYAAAWTACALGLMAKPVLVSLPFVLLLLDAWPFHRLGGIDPTRGAITAAGVARRIREKLPFFVLSAASCIVTLFVQGQGGAVQPLEQMPFWVRLGNVPLSYGHYLGKLFWPARLAVFYPHPSTALPLGRAVVAGLFLATATALALGLARRRPWLGVGWLWYLGTLVPMIGLVQVGDQAVADRYAYLPAIGIFLALGWQSARVLPRGRRREPLLGAAAVAVVAALSAVSGYHVGLWRDSAALFTHTLAVTRDNAKIEHVFGNALLRRGRREEAVVHYREALRLRPADVSARLNIALALADAGHDAEAETHYRQALRLQPADAPAHTNFGSLLFRTGRPAEAESHFREALRLQPGSAVAHNNLGFLLQASGRTAEAEEHYREALRLRPDYAKARRNLEELPTERGLPREDEGRH